MPILLFQQKKQWISDSWFLTHACLNFPSSPTLVTFSISETCAKRFVGLDGGGFESARCTPFLLSCVSEDADFPEFLLIMKHLLDTNFAKIQVSLEMTGIEGKRRIFVKQP